VISIKQVPVRLDDELHKELKIIVIEKNTSIQEILEKFLKSYIEEHQKAKEQKKNG
jgi:metal-responsive CopG/Arc/MetJ family transcriptional regulator